MPMANDENKPGGTAGGKKKARKKSKPGGTAGRKKRKKK